MQRWSMVLATLVMLICGSQVCGSIENGGFESGLAGWAHTPLVSVHTSRAELKNSGSGTWHPTEGDRFAYLKSGLATGVYTLLSQPFMADAGNMLSLDVFFDAGDSLPRNDNGFVSLWSFAELSLTTLYSKSVADVGSYGADGWTHLTQAIASGGLYQLVIGVRNVGNNKKPSAMGVDNVQLRPSSVVAEPSAILVWSLIGATFTGLGAWRRRSRKGR